MAMTCKLLMIWSKNCYKSTNVMNSQKQIKNLKILVRKNKFKTQFITQDTRENWTKLGNNAKSKKK